MTAASWFWQDPAQAKEFMAEFRRLHPQPRMTPGDVLGDGRHPSDFPDLETALAQLHRNCCQVCTMT